jgi:hypothetical protein
MFLIGPIDSDEGGELLAGHLPAPCEKGMDHDTLAQAQRNPYSETLPSSSEHSSGPRRSVLARKSGLNRRAIGQAIRREALRVLNQRIAAKKQRGAGLLRTSELLQAWERPSSPAMLSPAR